MANQLGYDVFMQTFIDNPYIFTLGVSLLIQIVFFAFAAAFRSDKVTDLSYSLTFIVIALYWLLQGDLSNTRLMLSLMVIIWGVRLGTYLFVRILKIRTDSRFDGIRENFWAFAKFWLLQGIAVWVIMLPSIYFLERNISPDINLIMTFGFFVWVLGLVTETIADRQKSIFYDILKEDRPSPWIRTGLWKYSRYPNYFGEMLVWWGLFIFISPFFTSWSFLTIIGPIFITTLLLFVTGIPSLEKKMEERYGNDKDYQKYKDSTNLLIPIPKVF